MGNPRIKFATQVDEAVLLDIRKLARQEGRQLQSVVEEALKALLDERRRGRISPDVLEAIEECNQRYESTLRQLAK